MVIVTVETLLKQRVLVEIFHLSWVSVGIFNDNKALRMLFTSHFGSFLFRGGVIHVEKKLFLTDSTLAAATALILNDTSRQDDNRCAFLCNLFLLFRLQAAKLADIEIDSKTWIFFICLNWQELIFRQNCPSQPHWLFAPTVFYIGFANFRFWKQGKVWALAWAIFYFHFLIR